MSVHRRGLALGILFGLLIVGADWRTPPPSEGPESVRTRTLAGSEYVPVNDLARMLDATRFWRADVRKLVLRAGTGDAGCLAGTAAACAPLARGARPCGRRSTPCGSRASGRRG